ncbi:hypothetical protein KGP36_03950 [Patescibacteria group bacterium]|nr:hypothetical protein [Patescibacteria group bacterium]
MYCADGCGHYHYRDVDTDEVVNIGKGPRIAKLPQSHANGSFDTLAGELGINVGALRFTAKNDSGRPRALVNCLSDADIESLPESDQTTVKALHRQLLTVAACIGEFRKRAK